MALILFWRNMFAIVKYKSGSKQYFVKQGEQIDIDLLPEDLRTQGASIAFDVLLVSDGTKVKVGAPIVAGSTVTATFVEDVQGEKLSFIKYKKRKTSTRTRYGHRQHYSRVQIQDIKA